MGKECGVETMGEMSADKREADGRAKRMPLKIADWPWWLEGRYAWRVFWGAMAAFVVLAPAFRRRWDLVAGEVVLVGFIGAVVFGVCKVIDRLIFRDTPGRAEKLPSHLCTKCGYDVRGTLMRCPECGADTPFKEWLDQQHPLERLMFEKHLAQHPHQPESAERREEMTNDE